jgi:hypothetical protein
VGLCMSEFFVTEVDVVVFPPIIRTLFFISSLSYYVTCIVTLILNVTIHRRHFPRILRIISLTDRKLFSAEFREKLHKSRRSSTMKLTATLLILVTNNYLFIYIIFNCQIVNAVYTIVRIFCIVIFHFNVFQYITIVSVLKTRYRHIYSTLSKSLITDGMSHEAAMDPYNYTSLSAAPFTFHVNSRPLHAIKIRELRHIYSQLHDAVLFINKNYGTPILLTIISILLSFIPSLYLGVVLLKEAIVNRHELKEFILSATLLYWCMSILFMYVWLNSCCQSVTDEVHKLMVCIHKIQLCPNVTYGAVAELNSFTAQLKDTRAEFSVCGFFTLNLQFLCASFGVIATYIIVLPQLQ